MAKKTKAQRSVKEALKDLNPSQAPAPQAAVPQLDKKLTDQVASLRAVTGAYNLLGKGMFTVSHAEAVQQSQQFLQALYEQLVEEVIAHPQADLIEDVKKLKEARQAAQQPKGE